MYLCTHTHTHTIWHHMTHAPRYNICHPYTYIINTCTLTTHFALTPHFYDHPYASSQTAHRYSNQTMWTLYSTHTHTHTHTHTYTPTCMYSLFQLYSLTHWRFIIIMTMNMNIHWDMPDGFCGKKYLCTHYYTNSGG